MAATAERIGEINAALQFWRQGDVTVDAGLEFVHLADLSIPLSAASRQVGGSITERGAALTADLNPLLDEVVVSQVWWEFEGGVVSEVRG